jgi:hypothetical protein
MELKSRILYFIVSISAIIFAGAAFEEIIVDKHRQEDYAKKQLDFYKGKLSAKNNDAAKLKRSIDSTEARLNDLNNFLKNYQNETYLSPDKVAAETNTIIYLTAEVEKIQENFRKKVINLTSTENIMTLSCFSARARQMNTCAGTSTCSIFHRTGRRSCGIYKARSLFLKKRKKCLPFQLHLSVFMLKQKEMKNQNLNISLKICRF